MRRVDPQLFKILDGRGAKQIVPNPRHHEDVRAAEPRGHRLVSAFPAESQIELLPKDSFPRLGKLLGERSQINIGATHHRDARTLSHSFLVTADKFTPVTCVLGRVPAICYRPFMGQTPAFCGVILAAGESSRMGRDKALLPWPPSAGSPTTTDTFLSAAIRMFFSHVDVVLVVAGKNEAALAPVIYANGASLVVNPDPARGQFSSLRVGLQEVLNRGRDAAMITLVDRPPVRMETLQTLEAAFEQATTTTTHR